MENLIINFLEMGLFMLPIIIAVFAGWIYQLVTGKEI